VTGTFEQHDQRYALGESELCDAPTLRGAARSDRTGQDREVLCAHHDRTTIDTTSPSHDSVPRHIAHERPEFAERTGIKEMIDPLSRIELSLSPTLRKAFLATHRPGGQAPFGKVLKRRPPTAGHVC
jgi:hypothetical protein